MIMAQAKVVFLKLWQLAVDTTYYYYIDKKNYGSSLHFKEDSNALKYILLEYCINKLKFEV
jgi:hypothetical protein